MAGSSYGKLDEPMNTKSAGAGLINSGGESKGAGALAAALATAVISK